MACVTCENPDFAVVCDYLHRFAEVLGIKKLSIDRLEQMLEKKKQISKEVIDLHVHLMRRISKGNVPRDKWERCLSKICLQYSYDESCLLLEQGYLSLNIEAKLRLLKYLTEKQFDHNQKLKQDHVNKLSAESLRTVPIGKDMHGHAYWYLSDADAALRIYEQEFHADTSVLTWKLIGKKRDDLANLIDVLKFKQNQDGTMDVKESANDNKVEELQESEQKFGKVKEDDVNDFMKCEPINAELKSLTTTFVDSNTAMSLNCAYVPEEVKQGQSDYACTGTVPNCCDAKENVADAESSNTESKVDISHLVSTELENIVNRVCESENFVFDVKESLQPEIVPGRLQNGCGNQLSNDVNSQLLQNDIKLENADLSNHYEDNISSEKENCFDLVKNSTCNSSVISKDIENKEDCELGIAKQIINGNKGMKKLKEKRKGKFKQKKYRKKVTDIAALDAPPVELRRSLRNRQPRKPVQQVVEWSESSDECEKKKSTKVKNKKKVESDDEFLPSLMPSKAPSIDSEIESDSDELVTIKQRARTVKKTENESNVEEDGKPCSRCDKDHDPECILLCDTCDDGYHLECLNPPLTDVPDGNWYCPPCEHKMLIEALEKQLAALDGLLKEKERLEHRNKRLAYVNVNLSNLVVPKRKNKIYSEEEEESEESDESDSDLYNPDIWQRRSRRKHQQISYKFEDFDELIEEAVKDEVKEKRIIPPGRSRGKDMSNIEGLPPEDTEQTSSSKKLKNRKLTSLDDDTEDNDYSDISYKGSDDENSESDEVTSEPESESENFSGDSLQYRRRSTRYSKSGKQKRGPKRRQKYWLSDSSSNDTWTRKRRRVTQNVTYKESSGEDSDSNHRHKYKQEKRKKKSDSSDEWSNLEKNEQSSESDELSDINISKRKRVLLPDLSDSDEAEESKKSADDVSQDESVNDLSEQKPNKLKRGRQIIESDESDLNVCKDSSPADNCDSKDQVFNEENDPSSDSNLSSEEYVSDQEAFIDKEVTAEAKSEQSSYVNSLEKSCEMEIGKFCDNHSNLQPKEKHIDVSLALGTTDALESFANSNAVPCQQQSFSMTDNPPVKINTSLTAQSETCMPVSAIELSNEQNFLYKPGIDSEQRISPNLGRPTTNGFMIANILQGTREQLEDNKNPTINS